MPCSQDVANENQPDSEPATTPAEPADAVTVNEGTYNPVALNKGAPLANMHHGKSMLNSDPAIGQLRLKMGKLPPSLARVERSANKLRKILESAVLAAWGEIDVAHALAINTAARWERHADLALRWLREHGAEMSHAERLQYSREIARASAERDKAVASLGLGAAEQDEMDVAVRIVEAQLRKGGSAAIGQLGE